MGNSPERADDAGWSELDQTFFAGAPPDVPDPPAEPPRFDDLVSATPRRPRRSSLSRAVGGALAGAALMAGVFAAIAIRKGRTENVVTAAVITEAPAVVFSPAPPAPEAPARQSKQPARVHRKPAARASTRKHRIMASLPDRRTKSVRRPFSSR